jgi:hypothetical protein
MEGAPQQVAKRDATKDEDNGFGPLAGQEGIQKSLGLEILF